jgi:predicted nucleic acid-binding protein
MIILDTNIISELMKQSPSSFVSDWIDKQEVSLLFVSSITIAELSYGICVLPEGARKNHLNNAFNTMIKEAFKHRVLFFNEAAAYYYGKLMAHRKNLGRPLSILDGQIAAITVQQGASLATRNTKDFSGCGLDLINPFNKS